MTARGNERRDIFRGDKDREHFLGLVGELEERFGLEVHAYVLMSNHYHLLVRMARESGLSVGMQWLGVSYSVWFNRWHRRSGHLFQGRFKAVVVDFPEWGTSLSRYIHLNPVRTRKHGLDKAARAAERAGLGEKTTKDVITERLRELDGYRWSSFRAYCGKEKVLPWLRREEVLAGFGRGASRRREYRKYVEEAVREGIEESPWESLIGGLVLGGEELLEVVRQKTQGASSEQSGTREIQPRFQIDQIVAAVSKVKGEAWEMYRDRRGDWGRAMVLMVGRRKAGKYANLLHLGNARLITSDS